MFKHRSSFKFAAKIAVSLHRSGGTRPVDEGMKNPLGRVDAGD